MDHQMKRLGSWLWAAALASVAWPCFGEGPSGLDRATKGEFQRLSARLAEAQRRGNEAEVERIAGQGKQLLGEAAGVPERADSPYPVPKQVEPLAAGEIRKAFTPYRELIQRRRWWRIGLDPANSPHLPREVAAVISGCLAARRAGAEDSQTLLSLAQEAGDYLVWTQKQGGTGGIPFPAARGGNGRAMEAADRFLERAERAGLMDRVVRNGWIVDDLGDGGLQFDNGLGGAALWELFEATGNPRYAAAARAAADWATRQPAVPNWNYNSFSVYLLAKTYLVTREKAYLDAADRKARLGIYPGQLTEGKYAGRWADPHNASIAYHYILVRGLAALVLAMPEGDSRRPPAVACLKQALVARNRDFGEQGASNLDSALEALLVVKAIGREKELRDCGVDQALGVLDRLATAAYRSRRDAVSPGVWGRYLEFVAKGQKAG